MTGSTGVRAERVALLFVLLSAIDPTLAGAQSAGGSILGTIVDQVGAGLEATVVLSRDGRRLRDVQSDVQGRFIFTMLPPGRYRVEAEAEGFSPAASDPVLVETSSEVRLTLTLQIGPITQHVVVTASAAEIFQSQVGSPVTVFDRTRLRNVAKVDLLESLRHVPGTYVLQTGQRGGQTGVFVRGGASDFSKVLIDGVPANDIGGAFDFGVLSTAGVDRVEVLRTANSVQHGADALSGVINLTTLRSQSSRPELTYSLDGGNLGTLHQEMSLGGVVDRVDYYVDVSRFDTDNNLPNSDFRNNTVAGRVGVSFDHLADLSVTIRHIDTAAGVPGAVRFNGIADDSRQDQRLTFLGVRVTSQLTERLGATVRFASNDQRSNLVNPTPTGEPFDPFGFGVNYLGAPVTIVGANGFRVSGRPIVDFGGTYPALFDSTTSRRSVSGHVDYRVSESLDLSGGARLEYEDGTQDTTFDRSSVKRTNVGSFVEARTSVRDRVFLTGGVGFDDNEAFGFEATPRLSAAVYLRPPSVGHGAVDDTKLTLNIGRGIKAPTVFDELNSIHAVLAAFPDGDALVRSAGVEPINAERSRSFDIGVEQGFWGGRARARVAFFHNTFSNLVEFVSNAALPALGVPADVAFNVPFGATVNAASYRAHGLETSADFVVSDTLQIASSYTFLDATVTESFSGSALAPSVNPTIPGIEIGAFSPLVGARPFRRPTHTGSLLVALSFGRVNGTVTASFVGRSDDSTFLFDRFFGNSLLLPNRDLTDGYQKVDLSGSYLFHPRLSWYISLENLLNQAYDAAVGFSALRRTVRTGFVIRLGGE